MKTNKMAHLLILRIRERKFQQREIDLDQLTDEKLCNRYRFDRESIEDVSINKEYEYENYFKPNSYSKSFSQLSMLAAMTPSSSL